MKRISFKAIIKIMNTILAIIIIANFAYLLLIFSKEIKAERNISITSSQSPEFENLILELAKNNSKIKDIIKDSQSFR